MLSAHVKALQEELVKLAKENEAKTMKKCAQLVLAASGLQMLRNRMAKTARSK